MKKHFRMSATLFSIGLLAIMGQVVLLRELGVALFGNELIYILSLGIWLAWSAMGACIGRRASMPSHAHVIRVLIALGLIIPVASVFIRAGHRLCAGLPGTFLPFSLQISIVVFSLMPAGILAGYLFRLAAKQYGAEGGNLALAYGIESLGGVFGGVAATISMSIGIQNFFSACLCALFAVIIAWLTADSKRFHAKKGGLVSVLLCLCLIMLLFESGRIDRITEKLRHPNLLETRDIPYGRITITGQLDQYSVFLNNMLVWETGGTSAEEFIHPAMLQHPAPESVLLLGGSFAGLLKEILQHGPAEVICWELDKGLIDLVRRTLPTNLTESLDNPEVNIIHGDIRGLLRGDEKWDIILIGMADPGSSQGGRFYTQEFFSLCAESLNPGGIIALRLRTSENYWTPHFQELFRGIYNALKGEFQFITVLPGGMSVVTASKQRLVTNPDVLAERFSLNRIKGRMVSPPYLHYLYTNDRFDDFRTRLEKRSALPNTDARPVSLRHAWLVWGSMFFPGAAYLDLDTVIRYAMGGSFFFAVSLLIALPFLRRKRRECVILIVFGIGFCGMASESVLLLYYQMKNGILYQNIGLLLMLFMAGLTVGAMIPGIMSLGSRPDNMISRSFRSRAGGFSITAGMCLLFCLLGLMFRSGVSMGLVVTGILVLFAGLLTAAVFAWAAFQYHAEDDAFTSLLYPADLAGGCLGALIVSIFIIPLSGLVITSIICAILTVFMLLLI